MGIIEQLQQELEHTRRELRDFRQEVSLWMEDMGDDVKGNGPAAKFVSVSTLLSIRDRPGYGIAYRFEGTTVVYSRRSLVAYKKSRMMKKASQ